MKRIQIIATTLASMFCVCVAPAFGQSSVTEKYAKAVKLINEDKNYAAAIPILEEVVKEGAAAGAGAANDVANAKKYIPQLYYNVGLGMAQNKNYAAAETTFTKAIAKSKEYNNLTLQKKSEEMLAQTFIAQAGSFAKAKDYAKAAEIYNKGLQSLPNNTTLEMQLALNYMEGGQKDQGFAMLKKIAGKGGKSAENAKAKMEYYENVEANKALTAKNYPKAIGLLNETLKNNPKNALAQMMLIQAFNNMNRYDDVISKGPAAAAIQTDAKNKSDIYYMIGLAYYNKQQNDKALENFKKVTVGNSVTQAKERIAEMNKK